jgi:uncharacterized membrane protein
MGLIQLTVTLGAITFSEQIQAFLQMSDLERHLFQNTCLGAFPQVMLLFVQVILFYFQLYREALVSSVVTLLGSLAGALWTLHAGELYYGLGLLIGTSIGFAVALIWLLRQLDRLEYLTFSSQPMAEAVPFRPEMVGPGGLGTWVLKDGQVLSGQERMKS